MATDINAGQKRWGLNANVLKIIALVTMTCDHVGVAFAYALPSTIYFILRAVGRISYPLFAFFIAEGCRYTRNKLRHFLTVFILAVVCQLVYFFFDNSLYMCIFVTFSLSILLIYALDFFIKNIHSDIALWKKILTALPFVVGVGAAYYLCEHFGNHFNLVRYDWFIDYGFVGVLFPVLVYLGKDFKSKMVLFIVANIALAIYYVTAQSTIQLFCLLSIFFVMFYNGQRGKLKLKYLFYIYYPLHLALLQAIIFLTM